MTERKPAHMTFDSWIDVQIREAQDQGEFDDLPGKGKPIPDLDGVHDPMWWVKRLMVREGIDYLPPALAIRREAEKVLEHIGELRSEAEVRRAIGDLNERIRDVNRKPQIDGPPSTLMPLDVDTVVERWRAAHVVPVADAEVVADVDVDAAPPVPDSGARRRRRRRPLAWLRRRH